MNVDRKKELRRRILSIRRSLSPSQVEERSSTVLQNLYGGGLLKDRYTVAMFAAADGEVRTRPLFERLNKADRRVVLPRVRGKGPELDFYQVTDWESLTVSGFGIPEPRTDTETVEPEEFEFVLVPGVAFDSSGGRLGYGMGCYDRVLELTVSGIPLVGIGYDFQLVEQVPIDEHDVRLNAVVIERGIMLPR